MLFRDPERAITAIAFIQKREEGERRMNRMNELHLAFSYLAFTILKYKV